MQWNTLRVELVDVDDARRGHLAVYIWPEGALLHFLLNLFPPEDFLLLSFQVSRLLQTILQKTLLALQLALTSEPARPSGRCRSSSVGHEGAALADFLSLELGLQHLALAVDLVPVFSQSLPALTIGRLYLVLGARSEGTLLSESLLVLPLQLFRLRLLHFASPKLLLHCRLHVGSFVNFVSTPGR